MDRAGADEDDHGAADEREDADAVEGRTACFGFAEFGARLPRRLPPLGVGVAAVVGMAGLGRIIEQNRSRQVAGARHPRVADEGRFTFTPDSGGQPMAPRRAILLLVGLTVAASVIVFVAVNRIGGPSADGPPEGLRLSHDALGPGGRINVVDSPNPGPAVTSFLIDGGSCVLHDGSGVPKSGGTLQSGDSWRCGSDGQVIVRWRDGSEIYRAEL